MANFDEEIKKITDEILQDGTVDKIIRENIINGFKLAIERSFSYGKLSDAIRKKTDEVLVPFIEKYDMNNYIVKLDTVLSEIVNSTALIENKKILKNFKNLMIEPEKKTITVSELFEQYKRYVAKEMDTDGRDVQIEDTVYYKPMEVSFEFKKGQDRSWSYFDRAVLEFGVTEEEQQENLNRTIRLNHYKNGAEGWDIITEINPEITSLRYLDDFDVLLIRLSKGMVKLIINEESDWDNVISDNKPQETYK
jgi:hypothetical protein